jgi:hypothetical protein
LYECSRLCFRTTPVDFHPGGPAIRLATPDDDSAVRANPLEGNVRFNRVVKGGERFTVSFDGQVLNSVTDDTLLRTGKVAQ